MGVLQDALSRARRYDPPAGVVNAGLAALEASKRVEFLARGHPPGRVEMALASARNWAESQADSPMYLPFRAILPREQVVRTLYSTVGLKQAERWLEGISEFLKSE